jgi:hypothetical protein
MLFVGGWPRLATAPGLTNPFISTVSLDKTHHRYVMPDDAGNRSIMILNHWLVHGSSVQDNHAQRPGRAE